MAPTSAGIERLIEALRLDTPVIGLYDTDPSPDFEPSVQAKGRAQPAKMAACGPFLCWTINLFRITNH